jgi:hypothetical protein
MANLISSTVGSTTFGANYNQTAAGSGLGGRIQIVSVGKSGGDHTEAELVALFRALENGKDVGSTNDAFVVAGVAGTVGTDSGLYLALQGTGTVGVVESDYVTGITLTVVADFAPAL